MVFLVLLLLLPLLLSLFVLLCSTVFFFLLFYKLAFRGAFYLALFKLLNLRCQAVENVL